MSSCVMSSTLWHLEMCIQSWTGSDRLSWDCYKMTHSWICWFLIVAQIVKYQWSLVVVCAFHTLARCMYGLFRSWKKWLTPQDMFQMVCLFQMELDRLNLWRYGKQIPLLILSDRGYNITILCYASKKLPSCYQLQMITQQTCTV
jgi:hypothetical protein